MSFVALLLIALPLAGLITARWEAAVAALIIWPVYFLGLDSGWWGDAGEPAIFGQELGALGGTALTGAAVEVGQIIRTRAWAWQGWFSHR